MAKKKAPAYLDQIDLGWGYQQLIDNAIRHQWTQSEFEAHLVQNKTFQRQFPGLVQLMRGHDKANILLTASSLAGKIQQYEQLQAQYRHVASLYGIKVSRAVAGTLISGEVSADEFAARAQATVTLRDNPGLLDLFNQELSKAGQKKLDDVGILKFLAGAGAAHLYDAYEAAQLRAGGLDLGAKEALGVAKQLGTPGSPIDTGSLIAQVKATLGDVGPELAKSGINLEDTIISLSKQGLDPAGIGLRIKQLQDQRRALGSYVAGSRATKGAGGGLALYQDEGAPSGV